MAVPVYVQLTVLFHQTREITYASTSWIILSTAFREALELVLWSIRANRCCILYLRSSIRFWKLSIPRKDQKNEDYSPFHTGQSGKEKVSISTLANQNSRLNVKTYPFAQCSFCFQIIICLLEQYARIPQSHKCLHTRLKPPVLYESKPLL